MIKVIDPRGNKRVLHELQTVEPGTRQAIRRTWFEYARVLERRARAEINRKPKSGRVYIIRVGPTRQKRRHVASAPGESHANVTRALRDSIGWKIHGADSMDFGYGVGPRPAPRWAPYVELGTTRMDPRPSLENAINDTQGDVEDLWRREMTREFKR